MAITHIHKITKTLNVALKYGTEDKFGELRDDLHDSIAYAVRDKKDEAIYFTLSSFQNCTENTALKDFEKYSTGKGKKKSRTKNGEEVIAWHLVQSFDEKIPPTLANEIGKKLAEEVFKDFACVISTHTNTENIHNHIIICAWDKNGKKWNNCNSSYRKIRNISDKLCEDYGLNVLYKTQDFNLVKWKDSEGKTRFFEPTDRKIELIKNRNSDSIYKDDVRSYRNTKQYEKLKEKELNNKEIIENDINSLIPTVNNYENLLSKLRDIGYEINDKKKNGEWLAHISFKAPMQNKATRDNKIGDGSFYTRENLMKYFEEKSKQSKEVSEISGENIKHISDYNYGSLDLSILNYDYRMENERVVKRGQIEKTLISEIKEKDKELYGLFDTTVIEKAIKEYRESKSKKHSFSPKRKELVLVHQIQESFDNLKFIEKKNIHSQKQINDTVKILWNKYNQCLIGINKADEGIKQMKLILSLPDKALKLKAKIEENIDENYINFEKNLDENLLENYLKQIEKYNLNDETSYANFKNKIIESEYRRDKLVNALTTFEKELSEYDRCVKTLNRIDKENNRIDSEEIKEYQNIKKSNQNNIKGKGER